MNITQTKPSWLKIIPPTTDKFLKLKSIVKKNNLHTVCQEAHCPNMSECWSSGTATFLILGDICTRGCRFCAVKKGKPGKLDPEEPKKIALALQEMKQIKYVVLTSVDRDDLPDKGAGHFARCVKEIKNTIPKIGVEILIPDFQGNIDLLKIVCDAQPKVIAHNLETVEQLQKIRDIRASYRQSLKVLKNVKALDTKILTKTSLMLGLGEKETEIKQTMQDLREIDVDFITFGQYLKPKNKKLDIVEYITPEKFKYYKDLAKKMGFSYCASGPFVRSSYRAGEVLRICKKIATIEN